VESENSCIQPLPSSLSNGARCCKYTVSKCYVDVLAEGFHTCEVKPDKTIAFQKQIGARVRQLRMAKGISQEAFADACGLHRTHMSLLERGRVNITLNTLRRITMVLGIEPAEFFVGIK